MSIPLTIPDDWTPAQALAVYEMIDALQEAIWARYARSMAASCEGCCSVARRPRCTSWSSSCRIRA